MTCLYCTGTARHVLTELVDDGERHYYRCISCRETWWTLLFLPERERVA